MNNLLDKELIKKRFEKSLPTYTQNAIVQKQMAINLISKLIETQGKQYCNILEIGCGCGLLTKNILNNFIFDKLFVNDLVENAVNTAAELSTKIQRIYGDCEDVTFPESMDLIISNAALQWIFDFESQLKKVHSSLSECGIFAFSTFGEKNLNQIKALTKQSLQYYNQSELEKLLQEHFEIIYSHSQTINVEFDTAVDVLKHLKFSGVNSIEETKWSKTDLESFIEKYNNNFKNKDGKMELTYHPMYFIARKRRST